MQFKVSYMFNKTSLSIIATVGIVSLSLGFIVGAPDMQMHSEHVHPHTPREPTPFLVQYDGVFSPKSVTSELMIATGDTVCFQNLLADPIALELPTIFDVTTLTVTREKLECAKILSLGSGQVTTSNNQALVVDISDEG